MKRNELEFEAARYNRAARSYVGHEPALADPDQLPVHLADPYRDYVAALNRVVTATHEVLELGSGTGRWTGPLANRARHVSALDISSESLRVCRETHGPTVSPVVGDIANLPFGTASIDVVAAAGSLSYGPASRVDSEILRVLRPGGSVVVVDSLSHNPLYRLNRRLQHWRGQRTLATIRNMPRIERIRALAGHFEQASAAFYGSWSFFYPVLCRVLGSQVSERLWRGAESAFPAPRMSFKFVVVLERLIERLPEVAKPGNESRIRQQRSRPGLQARRER